MIINSIVVYGLPDFEYSTVFDEFMANCVKSFGEENNLELSYASLAQSKGVDTIEFTPDEKMIDHIEENNTDEQWGEFLNHLNHGQ